MSHTQFRSGPRLSYTGRLTSGHERTASENAVFVSEEARTMERMLTSSERAVTEPHLTRHMEKLGGRRRRSDGVADGQRSADSYRFPDTSDDELNFKDTDESKRSSSDPKPSMPLPLHSHFSSSSKSTSAIGDSACSIADDIEDRLTDVGPINSENYDPPLSNEEQIQDAGATFEDLVDRLLSQPKSKSDAKFTTIFLCLYRKFAAPSTLIMAIVRRFDELNDKDLPSFTRMKSQLRYLNILTEWVSNYPGDFAHPLSRRIVTGFVQGLAISQEYTIASKDISPGLENVSEDDDTEWACSDSFRSRANTTDSFLTMSSVQSMASTLFVDSPTLTADSSTEDVVDYISEKAALSTKSRVSATPSSNPSISRSDSQSTGSSQTLLGTIENAQRQAQLLTPVSRNLLTKLQWHQLMEIPEDQIARELTRIDWILYSSIRPRDLIRHVSLQADQKEKCKSLEHVNRMIHQFNHVAFWVTNMILLRDKSKHRAKALEKFMLVAWKLRHLNNYNSLGAVIAGINGTAVHRLSQTRELIPPEAQKQFMRLEILMGTQKSHFAYRLAFENTSTSRIPFLPLHRRDLVLAEQGNRTYMKAGHGGDVGSNDRINWKKFEIMGEVIVSIRHSQESGYPTINRNEEVQRLVLEGRFCKDDDVSFLKSLVRDAVRLE